MKLISSSQKWREGPSWMNTPRHRHGIMEGWKFLNLNFAVTRHPPSSFASDSRFSCVSPCDRLISQRNPFFCLLCKRVTKQSATMAYKGAVKVQKVMVQPINLIFRYLQNRSRVQVSSLNLFQLDCDHFVESHPLCVKPVSPFYIFPLTAHVRSINYVPNESLRWLS